MQRPKYYLSIPISLTTVLSLAVTFTRAASGDPITFIGLGHRTTTPNMTSNSTLYGDNWDTTWRASDEMYGMQNDGTGAGGAYVHDRIVKISGTPENNSTLSVTNLNPGTLGNLFGGTSEGLTQYGSGVYEVGNILYHITNYSNAVAGNQTFGYNNILKSTDNGANWTNHLGQQNVVPPPSQCTFTDTRFTIVNFIKYGMGGVAPNVDNAQTYVYLFSNDPPGGGTLLMRMLTTDLPSLNPALMQYYIGGDGLLSTSWGSSDQAVHMTGTFDTSIVYNPVLGRYLRGWFAGNSWANPPVEGLLGAYEAPHPWGPWTSLLNENTNNKEGDNLAWLFFNQKFISADGKKMWVTIAGRAPYALQWMPVYLTTEPVQILEAEDATLTGVTIDTSIAGYTGTGYVTGFQTVGDNCQFTVNVASAGAYIIKPRYNSDVDQTISAYVNGVHKEDVRLGVATWTAYTFFAWLNAGNNTITFKHDVGDGGTMSLDRISLALYSTAVGSLPGCYPNSNISPLATASASTTYPGYSPAAAADGIVDGYPNDSTKEWASNGEQAGAWIKMTWATAQTIGKVRLFDRPLAGNQVTSGTLTFSDTSSAGVGILPDTALKPVEVSFPDKTVTWALFTVNSATANNVGLAEFQVFASTGNLKDNWKFDENSGTTTYDASGNDNTGAVNGASWTVGHKNSGLSYDGIANYVNLPDYRNGSEFTVTAWVKPSSSGITNRNIVSRTNSSGPGTSNSQNIFITSTGKFKAYVWDQATSTAKSVTGTTTVAANTWYHVAMTVKNGGQMKLYVNGVAEGTPTAVTTMWSTGDRYYAGYSNNLGAGFFKGVIDEIEVYDKELTQAEIQAIRDGT